MKNFLQRAFRWAACGRPALSGGQRPAPVRGRLERLESRCMLSVAPAAELFAAQSAAGGIGIVEVANGSQPNLLKSHHSYLKFPELPSYSLEPPGSPPSGEPADGPWWKEPYYPPPPAASPPPNDAGGMIDIGDLSGEAPDTFAGGASPRETREVLDMLSSLKYRSEVDDELLVPAEDLTAPPQVATTPADPLPDTQAEGGMVAIVADQPIARLHSVEAESSAPLESLLDVSVHMDAARGRFQAFEVMTSEAQWLPAAAPDASAGLDTVDLPDCGPAEAELAAGDRQPGRRIDARADEETPASRLSPAEADDGTPSVDPIDSGDESSSTSWSTALALLAATAGVYALRLRAARQGLQPTSRTGEATIALKLLSK